MITGMGNLGPPLKATPDLAANRGGNDPQKLARKDQGESRADSFERTLGNKLAKKQPTDRPPENSRESRPRDLAEKSETRETRMENKIERSEKRNEARAETREDSKEQRPSETVKTREAGDKKEGAKGLSERQRVMQKFMDSMESEFGIPPQRIVEAMAQLSDKQLLLPPEDTASTVIDKLDLEPQDANKAEAMYIAMLGTLGATLPQIRDPEPLSVDQKAMMGAGGLLAGTQATKLLSSRERREALNNSLDQMNTKFFMKPTPSGSSTLSEPATEGLKDLAAKNDFGRDPLSVKSQALANYQNFDNGKEPAAKIIDPNGGPVTPSNVDPRLAEAAGQMEPMTEDEAAVELLKGLAALGAAAGALSQAVKADPSNASALKMEQSLNGNPANAMAMGGAAMAGPSALQSLQGGGRSGQGFSNGKDHGGSSTDSDSALQGMSSSTGASPGFFVDPNSAGGSQVAGKEVASHAGSTQSALAGGGAAGAAAAGLNKNESQANIQQIMNQAQYMIKKGGGEAVVKMSPEGMGQVHLRVLVNDGKVNVEMQTETKEAKKLIESSLVDLKSSLSTHKLAVDHVKVDVGNGTSSDNTNRDQTKQQPQQDMAREQARQFLGQFREDNLANRDGFYETTGIKAYGSRRQSVEPLKPADEAKAASLRRYQGSGKGSAVDLVA